MLMVTKKFEFEAAHCLPNYDGPCANLHGHSYKLEITVARNTKYQELNTRDMVIDFKELSKIVKEKIISKVDHALLNKAMENPTAENTILWIKDVLEVQLPPDIVLKRIKLWETEDSYAEVLIDEIE